MVPLGRLDLRGVVKVSKRPVTTANNFSPLQNCQKSSLCSISIVTAYTRPILCRCMIFALKGACRPCGPFRLLVQ